MPFPSFNALKVPPLSVADATAESEDGAVPIIDCGELPHAAADAAANSNAAPHTILRLVVDSIECEVVMPHHRGNGRTRI